MSIKPPKENNIDKAVNLTKRAVDLIPYAAIGTEILSWLLKSPFQKRSEQWQK